jgi:hypothetical protein
MGWAFTVLLVLSCSAVAKERLYRPPRLDTGQQDVQGVWIMAQEFVSAARRHEANYSLVHILEGAGERDRQVGR